MKFIVKFLLMMGVFIFSSSSLIHAQWLRLGLQNEEVRTIVVDPRDGNILYAASTSDFSINRDGRIFKSTDGGASWDTVFRGADINSIIIHPDSSNILFATVGSANFNQPGILKTTDAGMTWFRSQGGLSPTWEQSVVPIVIDPHHPEKMFCGVGGFGSGNCFMSTDRGTNWTVVRDSAGDMGLGIRALAIDPENDSVVYASTDMLGFVFKSIDGGITWKNTGFNESPANCIAFGIHSSTVYLGTANSSFPKGLFKSTDSGLIWTNIVNGIPGNYAQTRSIVVNHLIHPGRVFISCNWVTSFSSDSGSGARVFVSTDEGLEWAPALSESTVLSHSLALSPDELYLYAAVYSPFIGHQRGVYRLDITTDVNDNPVLPNLSFTLYQNYPNPFNPRTRFEITISKYSFVKLEVFDILGRRVSTIINEVKTPGTYRVDWNATDVPSGVYFSRLTAGKFSAVKKMLLMK